jgi:hypothetical protein
MPSSLNLSAASSPLNNGISIKQGNIHSIFPNLPAGPFTVVGYPDNQYHLPVHWQTTLRSIPWISSLTAGFLIFGTMIVISVPLFPLLLSQGSPRSVATVLSCPTAAAKTVLIFFRDANSIIYHLSTEECIFRTLLLDELCKYARRCASRHW